MMSNQDYRNPQDKLPETTPASPRQQIGNRGAYIAGVATVLSVLGAVFGGYAVYRLLDSQQPDTANGTTAPSAIAPPASATPTAPIPPASSTPTATTSPASPSTPAESTEQSVTPAPASTPATGAYETNGTDDDFKFNVRVIELRRVSGNSVLLKLAVTNTGQANGSFSLLNVTRNKSIYVVDTQTQQKAYPLQDTKGTALASQPIYSFDPRQTIEIFAQFPAPPATTQKLTIYFPGASGPIADVPITQ